ncbi:MAG: hypothetical protein GXO27_03495 [Chlorobi bacterium]|nr:hypothetical protein [Chlorobiota bacterium]
MKNEGAPDRTVKRTVWLLAGVLAFTYLYAALRYVVFGPYDVNALPIFITNKALAFSFVINLYILSSPWIKGVRRSIVGIANVGVGTLHTLLSIILIPSHFFKKFYAATGEMTGTFGAMILFGILAFILMIIISRGFQYQHKYSKYWQTFLFERLFLVFLVFIGLHIFIYSVEGWFRPSDWYGGMPPISLLSFLFLLGATLHFFQRVFKKQS